MAERDAIVVGAGLGGLAAAIELAARGWRVRVLEGASVPGGKAGVVTVDGVEADTGPSVLTLPDVLDAVLRAGGSSLADELELRAPSPAFRYLWPDGAALDVAHRADETLANVGAALGGAAERELSSFLAYSKRIWDAAAPNFVLGPAPSVLGVAKLGLRAFALVADIDSLRAMERAITTRVRDPHLRDLLGRYATYNGSDLRAAPATLNCIAHLELVGGGFGVTGGMYAVVRALVRVAERQGVEVRCGCPVTRILVEGGRVTGVEAGGERLDAAVVVVNADVGALLPGAPGGLLGPEVRSGLAIEAPRSMSGWTGILRARRGAPRAAHTVLFPGRSYAEEFADIFDRDQPPVEPTVYLCAQEACHGRAGWAAEEPVFVMVNAPAEPATGVRDPALWARVEATAMARLRGAGLADATDTLVWRRTPAELAARFPGSRGALYGAASNTTFSAFRRPANTVPKVPGLFLASGSAHPGGGMPLCLQSGRQAAAEVGAPTG